MCGREKAPRGLVFSSLNVNGASGLSVSSALRSVTLNSFAGIGTAYALRKLAEGAIDFQESRILTVLNPGLLDLSVPLSTEMLLRPSLRLFSPAWYFVSRDIRGIGVPGVVTL